MKVDSTREALRLSVCDILKPYSYIELRHLPPSTTTALLKLRHHKINPFPAVPARGLAGLFGASPTPPQAFSDRIS